MYREVCVYRFDYFILYDIKDIYKIWFVYDVLGNVFCYVLIFYVIISLVFSKC